MAWLVRCLHKGCEWRSDTPFEDHAKEWKVLHQSLSPGHRVTLMWTDLASKTVEIEVRRTQGAEVRDSLFERSFRF